MRHALVSDFNSSSVTIIPIWKATVAWPYSQPQKQNGKVSDEAFIDCIRTSLPYAWGMVTRLVVDELRNGTAESAQNVEVPPDCAPT
ncbi:hypothetical protein [Microbispora rosea]|uniref:hypothetical protein n=1 Tax=Microbispora rosea TaxID=58117 RepID=UPI003D8D6A0F